MVVIPGLNIGIRTRVVENYSDLIKEFKVLAEVDEIMTLVIGKTPWFNRSQVQRRNLVLKF